MAGIYILMTRWNDKIKKKEVLYCRHCGVFPDMDNLLHNYHIKCAILMIKYPKKKIFKEKIYNHIYMDLHLRLTLALKTVTSKLKYLDLSYFRPGDSVN